MAIVAVSLGSVGDTAARSAYSVQPFRAPAPNTLVLVSVCGTAVAGVVAPPTSVAGAGLTFSMVTSDLSFNPFTAGSQVADYSIWRAMGAAPDTSLVTATFAFSSTGCAMLVAEVSGVSQAGTNGANAINASSNTSSPSQTTLVFIAPSAASTANGYYTSWCRSTTNLAGVPFLNWVSLDSTQFAVPSQCLLSAYTTGASGNSMRWESVGNASQQVGAIVELVADNPAVVAPGSSVGAQWGQAFGVQTPRVFPPRVRGDDLVEPGHAVNTDPYTDTSEG